MPCSLPPECAAAKNTHIKPCRDKPSQRAARAAWHSDKANSQRTGAPSSPGRLDCSCISGGCASGVSDSISSTGDVSGEVDEWAWCSAGLRGMSVGRCGWCTTWFEAEAGEEDARSRAVAGVACTPGARHTHAPRLPQARVRRTDTLVTLTRSASRDLKPRSSPSLPTSPTSMPPAAVGPSAATTRAAPQMVRILTDDRRAD